MALWLSFSMVFWLFLSMALSIHASLSVALPPSLPLSVALTHSTTPSPHSISACPPFSHHPHLSLPLPQVCDAGLPDQLHALQCQHRPLRKLRVAPWAEDQGRLRRLNKAWTKTKRGPKRETEEGQKFWLGRCTPARGLGGRSDLDWRGGYVPTAGILARRVYVDVVGVLTI